MRTASRDDWLTAARVLDAIGRRLQRQYGPDPIPNPAIQKELCLRGYADGSVHPADYCYNLINKARFSFRHPLFIQAGAGQYRYVGSHHPYSGPVLWRPRREPPRVVGYWTEGTCTLEYDPRAPT